jgi:protein ImuB
MLMPERLVEPLQASWPFEPPATNGRILTAVLDHLVDWLLTKIQVGHFGVQRLLCTLRMAGHDPLCFAVELLRPSASKRALMELAGLQIERLHVPAEVTELTVQAAVVRPLEFRQDELFGGGDESNWRHEAAGLFERLSSRLGEKAVLRPRLCPDFQPEFAYRYEPLYAGLSSFACASGFKPEAQAKDESPMYSMPPFLKKRPPKIAVVSSVPAGPPRQFHWKNHCHVVEWSWGPERIETGWWRGIDVRRDYFLVETATGERFWLFRNLANGTWHLHGAFA